ncbi:MAG: hypothetical protein MSN52_08875 [Limosilactobacillus reuteri]|nr:hypothetical protein [Limosilactobacillus reuteri]
MKNNDNERKEIIEELLIMGKNALPIEANRLKQHLKIVPKYAELVDKYGADKVDNELEKLDKYFECEYHEKTNGTTIIHYTRLKSTNP